MVDPILNRRRILAGTAAALASPVAAVPALAAATVASHPDADLLDLCRRCQAELHRINNCLPDDIEDEDFHAECDGVTDLQIEIADTTPKTLAGLAAKARITRAAVFDSSPNGYLDGILYGGLFDSIEAMAWEAAHG